MKSAGLEVVARHRRGLVYWAGSGHARIEFDFAKSALITGHVLLQDGSQRLGLLRAQIDSLKIKHFDLVLGLLLESAEHQEEIPDIHSYLNAIGVALPVFRTIDQLDVGLRWNRHRVHSVMGAGQGNNKGEADHPAE